MAAAYPRPSSVPSSWAPARVTDLVGPASAAARLRSAQVLNAGTDAHTLAPWVQGGKRPGLVVDVDGNEYVDGLAAWGSEPWGAAHPRVRQAMLDAWDRHGAQISSAVLSPPAIDLASRLVDLAPASITRAEFSVTGTQAVESAVRFMRAASGRPLIIVFGPVYHGEATALTAAMSSDSTAVSRGAHVFAPGVLHVPYPGQVDSPFRAGEPGSSEEILHYLDWLVTRQVDPDQVAGVVIEPVTTEGGVSAPTQEFWDALADRCERFGWLLCVDEVQTGMGRCGEVFAIDLWQGVQPDLLILGKGLSAGGMPISAVLGSERVMGASSLTLGSTFGWQPAACAAALAGLDLLLEPGALEHVRWMEQEARSLLAPLVASGAVADVRAFGAEVAVAFDPVRPDGSPRADAVVDRILQAGVLAMWEDSKPFIRLQPPLNLDAALWRYAVSAVGAAVDAAR